VALELEADQPIERNRRRFAPLDKYARLADIAREHAREPGCAARILPRDTAGENERTALGALQCGTCHLRRGAHYLHWASRDTSLPQGVYQSTGQSISRHV